LICVDVLAVTFTFTALLPRCCLFVVPVVRLLTLVLFVAWLIPFMIVVRCLLLIPLLLLLHSVVGCCCTLLLFVVVVVVVVVRCCVWLFPLFTLLFVRFTFDFGYVCFDVVCYAFVYVRYVRSFCC
jgi:hypothetical protein